MELFFNILASLQGITVILVSIIVTTLGVMVKSEGEHDMGNNLINGGLMLVPCFFMLVFILGFRY